MLEMPVKDVRLPDVHLPDLHLPEAVTNFEWPKVDLPSVDVGKAVGNAGKAVGDAAAAVHIGRSSRSPRWPFAIVGLIAAAAPGWVVLTNTALRERLASGSRALSLQAAAVRTSVSRSLAARREDAVAFPAAPTAPLQSAMYGDGTGDATDYPDGLGSSNGNGFLADEEIAVRV